MSTAIPSQIGFDALPLAPAPVHRFTVDQYHQMIESGVLTENDRVQLIDGWIIEMPPIGPTHPGVTSIAESAIRAVLPPGWIVRIQMPITLSASEPEPDVVVALGTQRDFLERHPEPKEVPLVVEVADSTLRFDRQQKAKAYAEAAIPIYWILNLVDRQLEVFSDPDPNRREYRQREVANIGAMVDLVIDDKKIAQIKVADLLP